MFASALYPAGVTVARIIWCALVPCKVVNDSLERTCRDRIAQHHPDARDHLL